MPEKVNLDRRHFLGTAAVTVVAAELAIIGSANAQSNNIGGTLETAATCATKTPVLLLNQIDAGILSIGYSEAGPSAGPAVILLHGWPYDIHSFDEVTPLLASAGYRVLVPYLRGYGPTRFLSSAAFRNGQPSALPVDVI